MRGKKSAPVENGSVQVAEQALGSAGKQLPADTCLKIHRHMVRARAMEERMIKMSKSGEGYFWLGGPGVRHERSAGTDTDAYDDGAASVTPLVLDLTHEEDGGLAAEIVGKVQRAEG